MTKPKTQGREPHLTINFVPTKTSVKAGRNKEGMVESRTIVATIEIKYDPATETYIAQHLHEMLVAEVRTKQLEIGKDGE